MQFYNLDNQSVKLCTLLMLGFGLRFSFHPWISNIGYIISLIFHISTVTTLRTWWTRRTWRTQDTIFTMAAETYATKEKLKLQTKTLLGAIVLLKYWTYCYSQKFWLQLYTLIHNILLHIFATERRVCMPTIQSLMIKGEKIIRISKTPTNTAFINSTCKYLCSQLT